MTQEELQLIAYKLIRSKANDDINYMTNTELGIYVRGIVDMQSELYRLDAEKESLK